MGGLLDPGNGYGRPVLGATATSCARESRTDPFQRDVKKKTNGRTKFIFLFRLTECSTWCTQVAPPNRK